MKILSGVMRRPRRDLPRRQAGDFRLLDRRARRGISIILQELNLAPNLRARQHFHGPRDPPPTGVDFAEEERQTGAPMEELEEDIDPLTPVEDLRLGQQQIVEIARALSLTRAS